MTETRFRVSAMDCATEKDVIANKLGRLPRSRVWTSTYSIGS